MTAPALTSDQNILPVQAYFNIDGSFNTFIGQGHPFVVSATESIGINNVTTNATFYPVFSPVSSGQVTSLDVFTGLTYNPSTGLLTTTALQGNLKGIADLATNLVGSYTNALVYQSTNNTTSFIANGTTGQYLSANTSGAPTWVTPTFAGSTVIDDTSTNATRYPLFSSITSGNLLTEYTSSTKYQFNPNTGALTATSFVGSGASLTSIPNGALVNSSITVGTTSISLGSSSTTLVGLSSVTSTSFVGALTGNASSATTATSATVALNVQVTDSTSSSSTFYPTLSPGTTGSTNYALGTSSTKLSFVPNTGTLTTTALVSTGGSIDNTPIGATTASTGKFTTLEATGTSTLGDASTTYIQVVGDASYPAIKAAGGTNTPLVLQPLGTGALQAQQTTSTATGGNARGANAVDWQTTRSAASYVASGANSFLGGGINNISSGSYSVLVGGNTGQSTAYGTFVGGGYGNKATLNQSSVVAGENNTASGIDSFIGAGHLNSSTGWLGFIGSGEANSTTANAYVTQQATSSVTSGSTAVTLSGSNAAIKVGQLVTGTGIANVGSATNYTYVAAISGTSLTLSQNASASGSPTLSFYTPHGVVVGGGNNQATGSYSYVGGGGDAGTAANRNVASGDWSFVGGGWGNQATAVGAVVVGGGQNNGLVFGNQASNTSAFVGAGVGNQASGSRSSVVGGYSNWANADYAAILGGIFGSARSIIGNQVAAACNNPMGTGSLGTQQFALLILARQTTDATATVLTSNTSAASGTNQVILPNNSAYSFRATIIGGVTGAGNTASWILQGAIKRGSGVGTTAIVGAVNSILLAQDSGASTWAVSATADTTNGGLSITVTGQASTTIRWVCKVETTEMTY